MASSDRVRGSLVSSRDSSKVSNRMCLVSKGVSLSLINRLISRIIIYSSNSSKTKISKITHFR